MSKKYHLTKGIAVPIVGGPWCGGDAILDNLTPGTVVHLRGSRYRVAWKNKSPVLVPCPEKSK